MPAALDLAELLPLLAGERAPALQILELEFFSRPMNLLEALERSSLTPKLRALDLTAESFTIAFAEGLARLPFAALERLRLAGPDLPADAKSRLDGLTRRLVLDDW